MGEKHLQIDRCLSWTKERTSWTSEWISIIFSDEKKFKLEGQDLRRKRKKTNRSKKFRTRCERKLAFELRKISRSIAKIQNQAGLTHVLRQIVYHYITRHKKFIFKKWKHHPKRKNDILIAVYLSLRNTCIWPQNGFLFNSI